MTTQKTVTLHK